MIAINIECKIKIVIIKFPTVHLSKYIKRKMSKVIYCLEDCYFLHHTKY